MSSHSSPGRLTIANSRARWHAISVLGAVAMAVVVGLVTAVRPSVAAAVVSVIALSALLLSSGHLSRPVDLAGKRFRWVIFAWAFLLIEPIGHFTAGRTRLAAVAGVPSAENVIELA